MKKRDGRQLTKLDDLLNNLVCSSPDTKDSNADGKDIIRPRILNGVDAEQGRYDYMVSLTDADDRHLCGGTLIAPDIILTAAHCYPFVKKAQIGRYDTSNNNENFETISFKSSIRHPDYDSRRLKNDFMIIWLESPSLYSPISGLQIDKDQSAIPSFLKVIGWGIVTKDANSYFGPLQEAEFKYLDNERCEKSCGRIDGQIACYKGLITNSMMCANDPISDACSGDSGSPLFIKGKSQKEDVQVGIASWGFGCGLPDFPGVYARISTGFDWIKEVTCILTNFEPSAFKCSTRPPEPPECTPDRGCRDPNEKCVDGKCVPKRNPGRERPVRS